MAYFLTDKKELLGLSDNDIEALYAQGYVLTRLPQMNQTRSLRINLNQFELSSENRRVIRKTEQLMAFMIELPLQENTTNWQVYAMCKRFYAEKFKDVEFSANKAREILTTSDQGKTRFNGLLMFPLGEGNEGNAQGELAFGSSQIDHSRSLGYCIVYKTPNILHYCYPFYKLESSIPNLGMGMMLRAIEWAKNNSLKYVYLGSFTRPTDIYKLQFKGLEWWNGNGWSNDLEKLKATIN